MTLPLPNPLVQDPRVQQNFDVIAQQFPVTATNMFGAGPTTTATLPTGTLNGQDFYYRLSGGGVWHLKYDPTSAKWDFSGGPALYNEVVTDQTTASGTYVALTTAGPSIALPFAGDYQVEVGVKIGDTSVGYGLMSYDIGGTGAVDADAVNIAAPSGVVASGSHARAKTGLTAVTLTAKYRAASGTPSFGNRWMRVTPVRVG